MTDEEYTVQRPEDFVIRVRPSLDNKGVWDGEIDVAILTQKNDLNDDDYFQIMHFCKMLASTIPIMEVNEDLRELAHNYVVETIDKEYEIELEQKPDITYGDDNIVTIDFKTNTKGNA